MLHNLVNRCFYGYMGMVWELGEGGVYVFNSQMETLSEISNGGSTTGEASENRGEGI